jgi:hypothetical protein
MFDSVVGHEKVKEQLARLAEGRFAAHAFIFLGPSGIGKRTLALSFATALLKNQTTDPQINVEQLISSGSHPDAHFVQAEEGKRNIPVESIRSLCSSLQLKPYYPGPAFALIDNAHRMTIGACNAFLKTLEEPPGHAYIFLITDSPQRLPETILSRCQLIHFSHLEESDVVRILSRITEGQEQLAQTVAALSPHSLDLIEVDQFVNPQSLKVDDSKKLLKHLKDFEDVFAGVLQRIDTIVQEDEVNTRAAKATTIISELCADKEKIPLVCSILRARVRKMMLESKDTQQIRILSQTMLDLVEAEHLIEQRSLNPQLKLSSVFC